MVAKANTLFSLKDLRLSAKSHSYFMRKYSSIDEIVWLGRYLAYVNSEYPEAKRTSRDSILELIWVLDKGGFIRHDIVSGSFSIGRLYREVFNATFDAISMPCDFYDLCEAPEKKNHKDDEFSIDYRAGNEKYEEFKNPSDSQLDAIRSSLRSCLNEMEYAIIAHRFGFEDDRRHSIEDTSRVYDLSRGSVQQIESRALKKLRDGNALPIIGNLFNL
ncbi:hypothetical protein IKT18_02510 [Candidatus Saccharibacteria bacterium]|nr:hypothetical protein [Candidatus Saccharibacteria bacterium]